MKLVRLESAAFGVLDLGAPVEFEPGMNVCVAPNQAGKTTLLTLIEWLLYGVPPHGRRRSQEMVERYRPWGGGAPEAAVTLSPEHPDWPEGVTVAVRFEEFTPQVRALGSLEDLAASRLFSVERNGTWDLGWRLTGLSREGLSASLLAPQGQLDNVLREDQLRRLLSIDLADLVEDPERASLEGALAALDRPVFTMGELSKGPVQTGTLLREATNHWQMAKGDLETQQERYDHLADMLAQRELKEGELAEASAALAALSGDDRRLDLAAAHLRFTEVDRLHARLQEWQPRLAEAPWLAEFPTGLQRELDGWAAEHRGLEEQAAAAAGKARDAEALRLRAPYVELVRLESEQDIVRWHGRLATVLGEQEEHETRRRRAEGRLADIDRQLGKYQQLTDEVAAVEQLTEQRSALAAAQADLDSAAERMREYGEGRDATERKRMSELETQLKPYRSCMAQVGEYLGQHDRQQAAERELAVVRGRLTELERGGGGAQIIGGGVLAVIGLLGLLLRLLNLLPAEHGWIALTGGAVLIVGGVALLAGGLRRKRASGTEAASLKTQIEQQAAVVREGEQAVTALASGIRERHQLSDDAWQQLVEAIPEYQQLRLSLEEYSQALRDHDGAATRRAAAWEGVRGLSPEAGGEVDAGWLDERLRLLQRLRGLDGERLNELSKLRDEENALERLARDESGLVEKLAAELEPLGLGEALRQDADAALRRYQTMAGEAKQYRELLRRAAEAAQLDKRLGDLRQNLARKLGPLGLAEQAAADPSAALGAFERLSEEAGRYARLAADYESAEEQARQLPIDRDEYVQRWQAATIAEREQLSQLTAEGADYEDLARQRRDFDERLAASRHQVDQLRSEVERLRERVAKDDDVRDALEEAAEREQRMRRQLEEVRRWQRGLEILEAVLGGLQRELSSRLAPQLTEELEAVLTSAPVAGVRRATLSGQLAMQLEIEQAPPGLETGELLERLSTGARLQLALALRIAVAKALGAERRACLLLDEPLAELDDERAVACLRYIHALTAEHQVLLTTCHAQHYEWLAAEAGIRANQVILG